MVIIMRRSLVLFKDRKALEEKFKNYNVDNTNEDYIKLTEK